MAAANGTVKRRRGRPSGRTARFRKVALRDTTFEIWRELKTELGFYTDDNLACALMHSYREQALRGFTLKGNKQRDGFPTETSSHVRILPRAEEEQRTRQHETGTNSNMASVIQARGFTLKANKQQDGLPTEMSTRYRLLLPREDGKQQTRQTQTCPTRNIAPAKQARGFTSTANKQRDGLPTETSTRFRLLLPKEDGKQRARQTQTCPARNIALAKQERGLTLKVYHAQDGLPTETSTPICILPREEGEHRARQTETGSNRNTASVIQARGFTLNDNGQRDGFPTETSSHVRLLPRAEEEQQTRQPEIGSNSNMALVIQATLQNMKKEDDL
ncbi:uncharacterized protein LOC135684036 [Rhopilema esculentum]|uniref:uncharacterized protein LOC135684036 n=1 Tax=Rhopilema esculentum TaxID=499914 RepID=UPI0031E26B67